MALAPEPERAAVALVGVRGQRFCRLVRNFASLRSYLTFARDEFDRCDEVQSARVLHHRNRVAAAEAPAVESPEPRIQGQPIVPPPAREVHSARVLPHRNRAAAPEAPAVESPELRIKGEAIAPAAPRAGPRP